MKNKIHFIGIGGIGMSAIARILKKEGHKVTGSDRKENAIIREMRREGIKCYIGHNSKHLGEYDIVVYSSSIKEDNVELKSARKRGLRVMHRAEILSRMIHGKISIAVTGMHGKTTTSAIIALIFEKAGLKPSAVIGGEVFNFQSNALRGKGDYFILEADESDGSFLKFYPDCEVLLNIDREHFDYFRDIDNVVKAFKRFIENVKKEGTIYYNSDDSRLSRLMKRCDKRMISFGTLGKPKVKAVDIRQSGLKLFFKCIIDEEVVPGEFIFPMPGYHNVTNALAAIAVAYDRGIDFHIIKDALGCYKGTKRRFEVRSMPSGVMIVEDYAHHPAEIEAILQACEPLNKNRIVIFQPHRYTRTKDLFKEFIDCFKLAEHVILTDIYSASEKTIKGVTSERLFLKMRQNGMRNVEYMKKDAISRRVKDIAGKNDVVLVLGAGDINDIVKELT
jgi:UDP-N-acetylmuramate--alanine ligase